MKRGLLLLMLSVLLGGAALAKPWWMRGVESNETDFLPPDVAFRVGAQADGNSVRVRWVIADGYYLYRSKITVMPESPDLIMARMTLPPGTVKRDPYLGSTRCIRSRSRPSSRTAALITGRILYRSK